MTTTFQESTARKNSAVRVTPSKVDPATAKPFSMDQELKPFGSWASAPIWVPPKDSSTEMAESMLRKSGLLTSRSQSWSRVVDEHRDNFTQVRELELPKASIRLPKGKLFVTVTEQRHFDRITDTVPGCVQTRLEEFLAGPGKQSGVKVYYLKPLCVEVGNDLHFTSREDVFAAINKIQNEVFSEYRRMYFSRRAKKAASEVMSGALAIPRSLADYVLQRRQKAIDALEAKLEFRRRQTALDAAKTYRQHRTGECTFDDMLEMTAPLKRDSVIRQYSVQEKLSRAKQAQLLRIAAGQLPWFAALAAAGSAGFGGFLAYSAIITIKFGPPLIVCDPAFVAELPGSGGVLLNIGHFDDIAGVRHVEM